MFRVAICDDDEKELEQTLAEVNLFLEERGRGDAEVLTFLSGEELLGKRPEDAPLGQEKFDVYILDIIMKPFDGIQIGRMLRERGDMTPVIYTTAYKEYAFDAYGIHAIDYLLKPVRKDQLAQSFGWLLDGWEKRQAEHVLVKTKDGMQSVKLGETVYIENVSRCIVYHLTDGSEVSSVSNRGRFEDAVSEAIGHRAFLQPHKSYLVNMEYIRKLTPSMLLLKDGREIPVSRNRKVEVKRSYLEYLARLAGRRSE